MKCLILDRDGVINQDSDAFVKSAAEWLPIAGSIEAIAAFTRAGYRIFVATNQSGLGRGLFDASALLAMHQKMNALVNGAGGRIDGIFYCPHTPDDGCDCRKPLPGLIDQIEHSVGQSLAGSPIVGDSLRDLEAGMARDCLPVLVKTGKGSKTLAKLQADKHPLLDQLTIAESLADYASSVLGGEQ